MLSRLVDTLGLVALCAMPFLLAGRAPADIGAGVLSFLFLLHCVLNRHFSWLRQTDIKILLALWVYTVFASALIWPQPRETLIVAFGMLRFVILYAALRFWLLRDERHFLRLSQCTLAAVVLIAADTYWQYVTGVSLTGRPMISYRLTGPLSSPNVGNLLLKLCWPAATWMLYYAWSQRHYKIVAGVAIIATAVLMLIPLTGERSITLLMLAAFCTSAFMLCRLKPSSCKIVALAGLALIAGAALISTQAIVHQRVSQLETHLQHFWDTPYGQLYDAAFEMARSHPVFGVGLRQYPVECAELQSQNLISICDVHAHNIYLQWLAETGLVGACLFILFAFVCLRTCLRAAVAASGNQGIVVAGMAGVLLVLLFPVIVTQNPFSNWPAILFWFTLGVTLSALHIILAKRDDHA